jgi:UDP-N-acetylglucosamine transferase subunit ALG13
MLERVHEILPPDVELLVQSGVARTIAGRPAASMHSMMSPNELSLAMLEADAVVAHAGIGSLLAALDVGKMPILVPRMRRYREHVDDHQVDVARTFAGERLAIMADAATLCFDDIAEAARYEVTKATRPMPFYLA